MFTPLNKFTSRLEKVLNQAEATALVLGKKEIGVEDLFWSLIQARGSLAHEVLNRTGFPYEKYDSVFAKEGQTKEMTMAAEVVKNLPLPQAVELRQKEKINFSASARLAIEKAVNLAVNISQPYVGTEHLLFAILGLNQPEIEKIIQDFNLNKNKILEQLKIIFQATANFGEMTELVGQVGKMVIMDNLSDQELLKDMAESEADEEVSDLPEPTQKVEVKERKIGKGVLVKEKRQGKKKALFLDYFARNLTDEKVQAMIDPLIGREREIQRLIQILCRRHKNNPVLLGEPGVGKTAIVEGLAKRIVKGEVPDILLNKKIYALDMNLLLAGTMMRGEFEARLKQILDEVKNNPDIIIFIDELHNVVGTGSASGAMDAANILKPALARGELRCIGATTFVEYKRHIEEDAALERRFQAIPVGEPTAEETILILKGIRDNYEKHHFVKISDEAIEEAVNLSERYLPEKFLPDKAIDLMDEAAAHLKIKANIVDENLRQLKLLSQKINEIVEKKEEQVRQENYPTALKFKELEMKLNQELLALEDKISKRGNLNKWLGEVTGGEVAALVSEITGVPLENLTLSQKSRLVDLEKILGQRIIGQDEVLKAISFYLKRAQAGLAGRERPLGSFMFLGPSGVGKTETAKALAEEMFKGRDKKGALVRLDMSEFSEGFNVSRLIGSPAGYVGFKEGGYLTEAVRRNPYSVVLFDEIEKAHPEVFNVLLQILDSGILSDATGKRVDFKNTVIILTSNLGTDELNQAKIGFGESGKNKGILPPHLLTKVRGQDDIMKQVKEKFRPEFLNRLDKILIFEPLSLEAVAKIVELRLNDLARNLEGKKIKLNWSKSLTAGLAKLAYAPESGARHVKRLLEEKIENELAEKILKGEVKGGEEIGVGWVSGRASFKRKEIRN